jgi:hypothetical protein
MVASFVADLNGLGGAAAVVFASGFLTPAANQNGPAFGLFAALPNGTVVGLPAAPPPSGAEATLAENEVLGEEEGAPVEFLLGQNYPNPFNPVTTIEYAIPAAQFVTLKVYNMLGQEVATLVNEQLGAGRYSARFDGAALPSGTYIYRLQAGEQVSTRRFMLLK